MAHEEDMITPARRMPSLWTRSQRGVLIVGVALLIVALFIQALWNPKHISDPQPQRGARAHELADKIDPNTADWQTLSALPMLGEKRARDIIEYREKFLARHPDQRAFQRIEDLLRIDGIGIAMMETLRPYLAFNPAPTSQPR